MINIHKVDFPFEEQRKLTYWSDIAVATPELTVSFKVTEEQRRSELGECVKLSKAGELSKKQLENCIEGVLGQ